MDTSSLPLLNYSLHQYQWSSPSSDSEFYSMSSPETVSPAPSLDYSISLSPSCQRPCDATTTTTTTRGDHTTCSPETLRPSCSPTGPGSKAPRTRTRSRVRSKQRESASEKEKLRMRDLTKALHHLRTYLPPSVAPAGQTLTKIETLRLTIRYISYLSAQLGLTDEVLFQRRETDSSACQTTTSEILGFFQCSSVSEQWGPERSRAEYPGQCLSEIGSVSSMRGPGVDQGQYAGQYSGPLQGELFNTSMKSFLPSPHTAQTTPSCQMYGKDLCSQLVPEEYWG